MVPTIGDEVSLFHRVNATDTWTFGASLSSGSIALHLNSTGTLHITGTGAVFQRGYCTYTSGASNTTDAVVIAAGGAWAFDASASTSPTTLHYGCYPSGSSGFRTYRTSGTASSYASIYNVNASTVASLVQNGQAAGGAFVVTYTSFTRVKFEVAYNNAAGDRARWDVNHSSFTQCDLINASVGGNMHATSVFRHEYNYHLDSWGSAMFSFNFTSKLDDSGTGVRSVKGNVFDKVAKGSALGWGDFDIRDNFFNAGYDSGASTWSIFTNNFVRMTVANAGMGPTGVMTDVFTYWDADQQNAHVYSNAITSGIVMTGHIFEMHGRGKSLASDDSGEFWLQGSPASITTTTITNSIFLADGAGYQPLQVTSLLGSGVNTYTNNRFICDHNTWWGGWDNNAAGAPSFSMVQYDEGANMMPGTLVSFRSNLLYNAAISSQPAQFWKAMDTGNLNANQANGFQVGPTTDVCSPSNCDYNYAYPAVVSSATSTNTFRYLNQGKGYAGNWTTTPGAHDVSGQNPKFYDWTRSLETFDSEYWRPYFGLSAPSAWSSGATYSQGDIVSSSSGTYRWGKTINFVYISSGFCAGLNPQPGTIPIRNWNKCWTPQSLMDIKNAIASSTTFTDASLGVTNVNVNQVLLKWIRQGYSPQNTAYRGTAHDGGDIGAVPYTSTGIDPLDSRFYPTVDTNASHYSTALGTITVTGSLYKVVRSSTPSANGPNWYTGYQMRNEIQSIQVHVSPATNQPSISVSMSNLVSTQTGTSNIIYATSTDIGVYREFYLHVDTPTARSSTTYHSGLSDYFPDILIPEVDPYWLQNTNAFPVPVLATQTQSAWIDIHVPSSSPSGYYSGSIYVSSGSIVVSTMPVVIGVWNWIMPSNASLATMGANFTRNGMRDVSYLESDTLNATYPNSRGGADFARGMQWVDGAVQMLDNRWSVYDPSNIFPGATGSFANYITEIGPLINGTQVHPQSSYQMQRILPGASLTSVKLNNLTFNSPEWQNYASTFTQQGWMNKLVWKTVDEPNNDGPTWARALSSGTATRTFSTHIIPNMVTTSIALADLFGGLGFIDNITPNIVTLDAVSTGNTRSDYDAWLLTSSGPVRQIGGYQSCSSAGTCTNFTQGAANIPNWPNRHIDGTPVANRAFETWAFLNRLSYEHYFALDICATTDSDCYVSKNPWHYVYAFGGHGDGTLMYPSTGTYVSVSTPIWCPSMRLKHFRDGEQDYEYANYLTIQGSGTFANSQIASWMTSGRSFSNNPSGILAARTAMGNAIHQLTRSNLAPVVVSTPPAYGFVGVPFSYQINATNSPTSYNTNPLPGGLTLDSATGIISGTPTGVAVSTIGVSATNAVGTGGTRVFRLSVAAFPPVPYVVSGSTAAGDVGIAFNYQMSATNSPTSYSATGLPDPLTVNGVSGLISGTPVEGSTTTVAMSATNVTGTGITKYLTIIISGEPFAPQTPSKYSLQGQMNFQGEINIQ